jgi:hypothetical protein
MTHLRSRTDGDTCRRNTGLGMDFLLVSPQLIPRVTGCGVDREYRGREKPSDHTPVDRTGLGVNNGKCVAAISRGCPHGRCAGLGGVP